MYNDIMDAVTCRLNELFGDEYEIYTDEVEQELHEPCFFVQFLEPSEKPMIGPRAFRNTGLCIQYMPKEGSQKSRDINQVASGLMDGMEFVALPGGDLLRGTSKSTKVSDGILNFFVNYNMFIIKKKEEEELMETICVKGEVR